MNAREQLTILADRPKWFDRMKAMVGKLRTLLCNTLRDLNVFPLRTFGSHVDRNKAKYLGQLTTRLYGLLLIVSFVLLALYTVIRPRIITRTFAQPSLERYRRLLSERSDTLQCPCSSISSTYHQFISVEPVFHPVSKKQLFPADTASRSILYCTDLFKSVCQ